MGYRYRKSAGNLIWVTKFSERKLRLTGIEGARNHVSRCIYRISLIFQATCSMLVMVTCDELGAIEILKGDIMLETICFKVFCLEQYKNAHGLSGREAMEQFKQYGVLEYISAFFDVLHSYGDKYVVQDIDMFIESRQGIQTQ